MAPPGCRLFADSVDNYLTVLWDPLNFKIMRGYLLLPLLASYGAAVQITVAKSGGNATSGLQYGAMEEVFRVYQHLLPPSLTR